MSGKIDALKGNAMKYLKLFKLRWKTPADGYDVSYKELTCASLGSMGHAVVLDVTQYVELASTSAIVSMVFGISFTYIYLLGLMGQIATYILTSINVEVMDNLGVISKKKLGIFTAIVVALLGVTGTLGVIAYTNANFLVWFEAILPDFMLHVFIVILCRTLPVYINIVIFRLFGKKWGKFKPYLIIMGIPLVLSSLAVAYIPYDSLTPSNLLLAVSFTTNMMMGLRLSYVEYNLTRFQIIMTRNRQERVIMNSIFPILGGLLSSVTALFVAPLASVLGYEVNSIEIYRIILPIFGIIGVIPTLLLVYCHERTVVAKNHVIKKVGFWEGFTSVAKNKYLWISKMSGAFNVISSFSLMILNWTLLYGLKMQYLIILTTVASLPATPANLLTPFLTKKWSNRQVMLGLKTLQAVMILSCLLVLKIESDFLAITIVLLASMVSTVCNKPASIVGKACLADAWDYHQWKFGERAEGASEYMNYVTVPLSMLLGYMTPFCYERVGFIGDYDVMYDTVLREKIFVVHILLYAFEIIMCMLPYAFYDLTPERHRQMMKDLEERAAAEEAAGAAAELTTATA
ncbi:MAG: MFS transporter [Bacillota bacterium]